MVRKKRILFHSDAATAKTGFGKNCRILLSYLYKTQKYEIVNYCCHTVENSQDLLKTSWKSVAAMPADQREVNAIVASNSKENQEGVMRHIWYGGLLLDRKINEFKPDFYFAAQDVWAFQGVSEKIWFGKINSVLWVTLDSLPIRAVDLETIKRSKQFWVWSNFAENECKRLGPPYNHVKTVHGVVDPKNFYRLSDDKKEELRKKFKIDQDIFIIGFVFRNQLRKLLPNLFSGYKVWKDKNPSIKSALLLHTNSDGGWNIKELAQQNGIPEEEVLITYLCRNCKNYTIKPFIGEEKPCEVCKLSNSMFTTQPNSGVTEIQLNEIYNCMDTLFLVFNSGGMEIPIFEGKLCELVVGVSNYSCGEEACVPEAKSLPLDWVPYREITSGYIKATVLKESIAEQLDKVYNMPIEEKRDWGKKARQWVIDNYSIDVIGPIFERFIDESPLVWEDENVEGELLKKKAQEANKKILYSFKDPNAVIDNILDDTLWLKSLYAKILNMTDIKDDDTGLKSWINGLAGGQKREDIEKYFRNEASKENSKIQPEQTTLEDLLDKDDDGRRMLFVIPESIGDVFICTSIFRSLKEQYPKYNLYVSTKQEYHGILLNNPYVHKVLPYTPAFDNQLMLEGQGNTKGSFVISFHPYFATQRNLAYLNNGLTNIALDLKYKEEESN